MKHTLTLLAAILLLGAPAFGANYRIDSSFGQGRFLQLTTDANDLLYALDLSGRVVVFNQDGTVAKSIDTAVEDAAALAFAPDGTLRVFSNITETKKVKSGARMVEVKVPVGVECTVLDASGSKQKSIQMDGLKSVKKACFIGDQLAIADLMARAVVIFDPDTGEETGRIRKGLRLCCDIFDICEGPDDTVVVSNLGAFKLQRFSLDGTLVMEFGKRGRKLEQFHGCCNPVSAVCLPDGEIMTIEKDSTRIKIYGANGEGVRQVEGVEELVKGCDYIPVTVDSQGVVYLVSSVKQCIVRCVPE